MFIIFISITIFNYRTINKFKSKKYLFLLNPIKLKPKDRFKITITNAQHYEIYSF